jgi:redox-sensitive bicupin YhaK (pirin superfamily)
MFPLLERDKPNPLELFQIWLNLPAADKMVDPHFAMLWSHDMPTVTFTDEAQRTTDVTLIAGTLAGKTAPPPPPRSWAARPDTDVAIWTIRMDAGAKWTLPPAHADSNRTLYFFKGTSMRVAGEEQKAHAAIAVESDVAIELEAGETACELLVLQGRPIDEPVVQHGPFVMNTPEEIHNAMLDYRRTRFGKWPWPSDAPVHAREEGRFARHADGRVERIAK